MKTRTRFAVLWGCLIPLLTGSVTTAQPAPSIPEVVQSVQPKMVKIFGSGGLRRLEAWQTGFFISEDGLIATVWSYVLDAEKTTVFLDNGQRSQASLIGFHPQYEIALLKVDVTDQPAFSLDQPRSASIGQKILAFSNLYGVATGNEKCSVQQGVVSALQPLRARRGITQANYRGPAVIVDAITSNPGAAGGVITDRYGGLLGLIGREAVSEETGAWLNYAIPADQVAIAVDGILAGQTTESTTPFQRPTESMTLELMGLVLVPDVVERTPPFVDHVVQGSPAESAGIQADDLVVEIDGALVPSRKALEERLESIDRDREVSLMLQRGDDFINVTLRVQGP